MKVFISILLVAGLILSIRTRCRKMMWRTPINQGTISKAITQLVGTAGGILIFRIIIHIFRNS